MHTKTILATLAVATLMSQVRAEGPYSSVSQTSVAIASNSLGFVAEASAAPVQLAEKKEMDEEEKDEQAEMEDMKEDSEDLEAEVEDTKAIDENQHAHMQELNGKKNTNTDDDIYVDAEEPEKEEKLESNEVENEENQEKQEKDEVEEKEEKEDVEEADMKKALPAGSFSPLGHKDDDDDEDEIVKAAGVDTPASDEDASVAPGDSPLPVEKKQKDDEDDEDVEEDEEADEEYGAAANSVVSSSASASHSAFGTKSSGLPLSFSSGSPAASASPARVSGKVQTAKSSANMVHFSVGVTLSAAIAAAYALF